jgi:DNA-binding MarR family transcriptional regulator
VTPPSMLRTVQGLVDHGYVDRTPHETDGRKQLLVITDEGQQMIDETRRRRNLWLATQIDALTPDERQTLQQAARIMERLAESDA